MRFPRGGAANPMKKRARKPGVPPDNRTMWRAHDGIAARMVKAIEAARIARGLK
jgi:hypothetical protein